MNDTTDTAIDKAKATLLRALDELSEAEATLESHPDHVHLVVVYSIGRESDNDDAWHEVGGWASTAGPMWLHAAMLRRAADAFDVSARADDNEEDDGDE